VDPLARAAKADLTFRQECRRVLFGILKYSMIGVLVCALTVTVGSLMAIITALENAPGNPGPRLLAAFATIVLAGLVFVFPLRKLVNKIESREHALADEVERRELIDQRIDEARAGGAPGQLTVLEPGGGELSVSELPGAVSLAGRRERPE